MPDPEHDRELATRLAAIDVAPTEPWVAGLRADLDAAWETGELASVVVSPIRGARRPPSRRRVTRRAPVVAAIAACLASAELA